MLQQLAPLKFLVYFPCLVVVLLNFSYSAAQVSLVSPTNALVADADQVMLEWNSFPGATHYHVQVASDAAFSSITQEFNAVLADSQLVSGLNAGLYYWRVRAFDGIGFSAFSSFRTFRIIDIASIPSLRLWWDPDFGVIHSGNSVSQWTDKSGNGNDGIQGNALRQPTILPNVLNGYPLIRFDGNLQYLKSNSFSLTQPNTIFFLYNKIDNGPNEYIFDGFNGDSYRFSISSNNWNLFVSGNFYFSATNSGPPGYKLINYRLSAGQSMVRQNFGLHPMAGNPGTSNPNGFTLGSYGTVTSNPAFHAEVDVAEVIIFDDSISLTLTQYIEQYLRYKFSPPVNLGRDVSESNLFCPITLNGPSNYTSYQWSTGATTPNITINASGSYWLQVTDIFGLISRDTVIVNYAYPDPNTIHDTVICLGDTLWWNTGYNHANYNFLWTDGSVDSLLAISQTGLYYVRIEDSLGCYLYSDSVFVQVNNFPVASLGPDANLCAGNRLELDMIGGPGATYSWSTGAEDSLLPVFITGTYWVHAINQYGCSAYDTIDVIVVGTAPTASFAFGASCSNDIVSFSDLSSTNDVLTSWLWSFGDGDFSSAQHPSHGFPGTGNYQVNLEVTTDVGCSNDTTIQVTIHPPPLAGFSYADTCERSGTDFFDLSIPNAGSISQTLWNFGDLTSTSDTSSLAQPVYSYSAPGSYEVQLIAENSFGCRDTHVNVVNIKQGPVALFAYNKECLNDPVQFSNSSSAGFPLSIVSHSWTFNPGSSIMINPVHTFTTTGDYPVILTVCANNGCCHSFTDTLNIDKFVDAAFILPDDTVCRFQPYAYQDNSSGFNTVISQWHWKFDDNGTSTLQDPVFAFNQAGLQAIRLSVTSADNCVDSVIQTLFVKSPPVAAFTPNPQIGFPPLDVNFINMSSNGAVVFNWDLGNGQFSNLQNPFTVYSDTGLYTVTLIVEDAIGCTDTLNRNVLVVRPSYDVLLQNLVCTPDNGYMQFAVTMLNQSNIALSEIDWRAGINNPLQLHETWTGNLNSGQMMLYSFTGQALIPLQPELCCVEAYRVASSLGDSVIAKRICAPLVYSFTVLDPFPNPVTGSVGIYYVLPSAGEVLIRITNSLGRIVHDELVNGSNGANFYQLDMSRWAAGHYAFAFYYKDERLVRKIVKD